jgi:hypothetical protein
MNIVVRINTYLPTWQIFDSRVWFYFNLILLVWLYCSKTGKDVRKQEKDVRKQEKDVRKQEKDIRKQEKDIQKQEKML